MATREYLVAYDYGMGGLWAIVLAESPEAILARYPELQISNARPHWMTDEIYEVIKAKEYHHLTDPPFGVLAAVVGERNHP